MHFETTAIARPTTILLAEDEALIRVFLAEQLRATGATVVEAASGDEAAAVLRDDMAIDVLVTDVKMPGSLDGIELAELARRERPGIIVIVISGHAAPLSEAAGVDAFLRKPFDDRVLVDRISRLLKQRDVAAAASADIGSAAFRRRNK